MLLLLWQMEPYIPPIADASCEYVELGPSSYWISICDMWDEIGKSVLTNSRLAVNECVVVCSECKLLLYLQFKSNNEKVSHYNKGLIHVPILVELEVSLSSQAIFQSVPWCCVWQKHFEELLSKKSISGHGNTSSHIICHSTGVWTPIQIWDGLICWKEKVCVCSHFACAHILGVYMHAVACDHPVDALKITKLFTQWTEAFMFGFRLPNPTQYNVLVL